MAAFGIRLWRSTHSSNAFRYTRAVKYSCYSLAAVQSMIYPSAVISGTFSNLPEFSWVWSIILLAGSLTSLGGILSKTWVGEYIGLWGVITALILYALGCFTDVPNGQRILLGLIFLGFAASSYARYQDVVFQKRIAEYETRVRENRPGL